MFYKDIIIMAVAHFVALFLFSTSKFLHIMQYYGAYIKIWFINLSVAFYMIGFLFVTFSYFRTETLKTDPPEDLQVYAECID